MPKIIKLKESDLVNIIKRVIKEDGYGISRFENPKMMGSFKNKKPSLLQRGLNMAKDWYEGGYSEKDNDTLSRIKNVIKTQPELVEIIRTDNGKTTARIAGSFVMIDKNNSKISVDQQELKLGDYIDSDIEHILDLLDSIDRF